MNTTDKLIVVTGATGQQGGATARHLLAQGFRVRALTRDPRQPSAQALAALGAEVVPAELDDIASLAAAFQGAYGIFSVQGFWEVGVQSELRRGKNVADAANTARVQHFVYTSVGGAERNSGIPHFESKWAIEQYIRRLELPATILRPVEFMENFNWSRAAIMEGTLTSQGLRAHRKKYLVAVDDIGAFAATAFAHPDQYIGKAIEIAGDALTEQEIAVTFSKVLGRIVKLVPPPADPDLRVPDELLAMWRWFDESGYQSDIPSLRVIYPELQTLETWLINTGWETGAAVTTTEEVAVS